MWGPRIFGAPPRLLTVVGDASSYSDEYIRSIILGDAIYAVGQTCLTKFNPRLGVLANVKLPPGQDALGLATDGTHIYVAYEDFNATYNWGVRLLKFDQTLSLVAQIALETTNADYAGPLQSTGGYLWMVSCCMSNGSTTGRINLAKVDPATLGVLANKSYYTGGYDYCRRLKLLASGNLLTIGSVKSTYYGAHVGIWDTTPALTTHKMVGGNASNCYFQDAVELGGNLYCVGMAGNDGLIVKFDASLNVLAQKTPGGSYASIINSIAADADGNLVACGSTTIFSAGAHYDGFGIKMDTSLNVLDQFGVGNTGSGNDYLQSVLVSGSAVYMFGTESGRNATSNGLALRPPKTLANAHVTGVTYLVEKAGSLAVATSSLNVSTPSLSNAVETWSSWNPSVSSPDYSTAIIDYGRI